ncbi:MAG: serine--tRNA ligase [Candidatus Bathyarchaeota archaeon]|jgi:seryl-tRNA synthetase|nr:serine--tRNA ligase [Candidatus Bathyarchaeota archaeon]
MLDIRLIRESPETVRENLARRHDHKKEALLDQLITDDAKWRELTGVVNNLRSRRNKISSEIGDKIREGEDSSSLREEASKIPKRIIYAETERDQYGENVRASLMRLPNMLHKSVPYGIDDSDNVELRRMGARPEFDFEPKSHAEIAAALGILDLERAAKISGSGFYYLRNELALLDYAIMQYAISHLLNKGFSLIVPPYMIRRKPYEGITDLADFESVMYKIEKEDLYLIATSEHAMGSMLMDEVMNAKDLPLKFCGVSPCFRKEIGTHGRYTKGLFRVHQFNKVEQFVFSLPEQSWEIHEEIQQNCEELYQGLGLYYRIVNVCTGDLGSIAAKKYDTEIWMADGQFRESGSNSNCTDYQARRLNIRYRNKEGQAPAGFVHTLNNTALATSRTMIAVLEQYQQADGSVVVPKALKPYMNGLEIIEETLNPIHI